MTPFPAAPRPWAGPFGRAERGTARIAACMALALALLLATAAPAVSAPTREDLSSAQERLSALEAEFSMAVEAYNRAQDDLAEVTADIGRLQGEIAELTTRIDTQREQVGLVVRGLYTGASARGVGALLDAGEATEVQRRASYLASAQRWHQRLLEGFAADRTALDEQARALEVAESRAVEVEQEMASAAETVEARLADQADEVASLTATIERLEREQAEREAALAAREAAEAAEAEAAQAAAEAEAAAEHEAAERASDAAEPDDRDRALARADRTSRDPEPDPAPQEPPAPSTPASVPAQPEQTPTSPPQSAGPSAAASAAVAAAVSQLGKPYRWGASGPDSYDCSGLTSWAWRQAGVTIPRSSGAQYAGLAKVDRADLRPGDLLFFGSPIHHVGMYVGNGQMIEAPYTGQVVRYRSIDRSDYVGAARPG